MDKREQENSGLRRLEDALFGEVLRGGTQCLSEASFYTGYSIKDLKPARDSLVEKKLIRRVVRHQDLHPDYASYEVNV